MCQPVKKEVFIPYPIISGDEALYFGVHCFGLCICFSCFKVVHYFFFIWSNDPDKIFHFPIMVQAYWIAAWRKGVGQVLGVGNPCACINQLSSTIAYNYLNLPQTLTTKGTISYTYDAAGTKLLFPAGVFRQCACICKRAFISNCKRKWRCVLPG